MKKILFFASAITALLATTSCSNEDNTIVNDNDPNKTKIALSASDDNTVMTSRAGFTAQTRILARIVSDKRDASETKCVRTVLSAAAAGSATYSNVSYVVGKTRYWDDAHGRNSRLSVFAVAIPNKYDDTSESNLKENKLAGADSWATTDANNNNIEWTVATTQTTEILEKEDLTYSNNIQEGGDNGVYTWSYSAPVGYPEGAENASRHSYENDGTKYDGRLYFTQEAKTIKDAITDAPGHFDKGQMEFHHSLSRIQVNLISGDGYSSLALTGNLQLNNMPYSGTLNIKSGEWAASPTTGTVNMAQWATADATNYGTNETPIKATLTYEAQLLPGYEFTDNASVNAMQFTIGGNDLFIPNSLLRSALESHGNYTMQKEKRYIFNITVKKNKIENITATVAPWVDIIAANKEVNNSHVTFTFLNPTGTACGIDDINFYKYEETLTQIYTDNSYEAPASGTKAKNFGEAATLSGTSPYSTNWYYQDNKTAYHFRTLNDAAAATYDTGDKTKFTMQAGATNDYHWGAPMKDGATLAYSPTKGFEDNIEKGIVAASAETNLKIQEIHMLSNIVVQLKTVEGSDAINVQNAVVTITNLYTQADVDMGIGLITPNTNGNCVMTCGAGDKNTTTNAEHTFCVIPQDLDRGAGSSPRYVGITIRTFDNNEYYVVSDLSAILANVVTSNRNQTEGAAIKTWFPGHTYIYTFTLKKKEIENITATVANWVNITAKNFDLDLEK